MPTAANLNFYRGGSSHVGWHSDDEPLFGKCEEAKLIVSVSFGTSMHFSNGKASLVRTVQLTRAGLVMVIF